MYELKIYGFWKCGLNESCSVLCDKKRESVIYKILNLFAFTTNAYLTCNVKLGMQNINFKVVNQHINDTCHV